MKLHTYPSSGDARYDAYIESRIAAGDVIEQWTEGSNPAEFEATISGEASDAQELAAKWKAMGVRVTIIGR